MSCAYKREPQLILYVIIVLLHAPPNITGIYAYLNKLSKGTLSKVTIGFRVANVRRTFVVIS